MKLKLAVVTLLTFGLWTVSAFAQDSDADPASDDAAAEETAEAPEGEAESDEGASDDDEESTEGVAEQDGEPTEPATATADDGPAAEGAAEQGEPAERTGPGGRPLRSDYPGTEDSLKSRMATDRIEGLEIDPGQPQEAYTMRVKELETKIDDLKEKVFQSKTRIVLLRETLLSGNLAGARASIVHRSELGAAFKLRQATYSLDGTKIFGQIDKDGSLADKSVFEVYNGGISPGNHTLSVSLVYQGSGYGLFTYFDGYEFPIRSSCQFEAQEGKIVQIRATPFEGGNATTSKENRPSFKCEINYFDSTQDDLAPQDDVASDDA